MRLSVYTSCAIHDLPQARALAESLKRHHPDASIVLVLNDLVPHWLDLASEPFDHVWRTEDLGYTRSWQFMHDVVGLCTAVKGRSLVRLMEIGDADFYIYLDPNVFIYNKLDPIADYMGDAEIGLTPHISKPETSDIGVRTNEAASVARSGVYNLGHLIVRDGVHSRAFARWWADRLDHIRDDGSVDQRWCDLAPALFDKVRILREPDINVASWNLHGRQVDQLQVGGPASFTIDGRPLLTYNFSGTGPGGPPRRLREIFAPTSSAAAEIERLYEAAIAEHQQAIFETWAFAGDYFDNGQRVFVEARRLYRQDPDLQSRFPDPYDTSGRDTFLDWLRTTRPDLTTGIVLADLAQCKDAFEDLFDEDFYLACYPAIVQQIQRGHYASALDHYVRLGSRLLFDPSPYFVAAHYFAHASKIDSLSLSQIATPRQENTLLWHYITVGLRNGIDPIAGFDSNWYVKVNPDILEAVRLGVISCPLAHFARYGDAEKRWPSEKFDPEATFRRSRRVREAIESGRARGPLGALRVLGFSARHLDEPSDL